MEMYDVPNTVKKTFDPNYLTGALRQAQWAEFIELKKVISEMAKKKKEPITILDIGVGDGRVPKHLASVNNVWDMIKSYDGIDNSKKCIEISTKLVKDLKIQNKIQLKFFDAHNLDQWTKKYDLVILTWFTSGNFHPKDFPFDTYEAISKDPKKRLDLSKNENFTNIFKKAYKLLNPGGEVVIGSCYVDKDSTRKKQEEQYEKWWGMHVITDAKDSFTAATAMFWSQRFTPQKIKNYLPFVAPGKLTFIPLDTYDYAMMVRIKN